MVVVAMRVSTVAVTVMVVPVPLVRVAVLVSLVVDVRHADRDYSRIVRNVEKGRRSGYLRHTA
jgi:hypothetical protein